MRYQEQSQTEVRTMADGSITIVVDVDGKGVTTLNSQLDSLEGKSQKASGGVKDLVTSIGLVKLASVAFDVLKSSLDAAISRFDTMQKFPKVLNALGFSADESNRSVSKLSDGIDGLPTKLDDVVSTAQRMTAITGNLDKSTNATLALNNAMLASGASTNDANRGMEQYIQMLSTGKVDLQSWKTLQETMPIGLQKTAEAMGFVGKTAQRDLYDALKSGTITFDEFQNKLIELGTGTGELAKLAKLNSEGIATSFSNLKNAASKGIANIIDALNDLSKEVTNKSIAQNLDSLKGVVNATFKTITDVIRASGPVVSEFVKILGQTIDVVKPLTPALIGLAAAYGGFKILSSINSLFQGTNAVLQMAALSGETLTIVTQAHLVAQVADTNATKADVLAKGAQQGAVKLSTLLIGLLSGGISAHTVATTIATAATGAFSAALTFLTGPIGIAVVAIGALVTAAIAIWKWFNKEAEEVKNLRAEQKELISSTDELVKKNEQAVQSRKEEVDSLSATKSNYKDLISEMEMLSQKEKLSTSEKKRMGEIVEELNGKLGDLNLVYDEQSNKLSEQPAKIQAQIDAFHALDEASSAQERINEMLKQRNDNEAKLMEINIARERWNETLSQSSGNTKEAAENIQSLNEQEQALKATQGELTNEIISTASAHEESMQRASDAVESGVMQQTISYDALQGKNKEVMDALRAEYQSLEEKVGNAFDVIQQKQAISTEQMIANLQQNQQAVAEWSQNIAILAERGVDQGLLEQLRKMGPEGAAQAAALVTSSDEQLQQLNEVFRNSGETSMNAMKEGYQLGKLGVDGEIANMIPTQRETLSSQIASADFTGLGTNVTDNIKAGVENGRNQVAEATKGIVAESATQAKTEVQSSDFKGIGNAIPEGLAGGIDTGKDKPKTAVTGMTEDVIGAARKGFDTHSPSKVFHDIGGNLAEGLANGIQTAQSSAISAVQQLVSMVIQSADGLDGPMYFIGVNAMFGLANGIESGSSAALAMAQSVANAIAETMQAALDIHSPSRVMRDKVGRYIPQGVAEGIEQEANAPLKAIDSLSSMLTKRISPESALRLGNIGLASIGSQMVSNSKTSNVTNTQDNRGLFDGATFNWNNKEDIRNTMQEIAWIMQTEGARLE